MMAFAMPSKQVLMREKFLTLPDWVEKVTGKAKFCQFVVAKLNFSVVTWLKKYGHGGRHSPMSQQDFNSIVIFSVNH